jgi:hypothetical protein
MADSSITCDKQEVTTFIGKSCRFGHAGRKYVSSGGCVECARLNGQKRRKGKPIYQVSEIVYFGPIVSLEEATREGGQRYFTGSPCPQGHVSERYVVGGACVRCRKDYSSTHPRKERTEQEKLLRKQQYHKEKGAMRQRRDAERLEKTGRPKPSICDVCKKSNGRIVFDHCHVKGHFRGWLCDPCNQVLGLVKDDPSILRSLAKYLERTSGTADNKEEEPTPLLRLCGS